MEQPKTSYLDPEKIVENWNRIDGDRGMMKSVWQQIANVIIPLRNDIMVKHYPGEPRYNYVYDSTAMVANETLAGALHSMLTSPTTLWFYLTTGNPTWDARDKTRMWLQDTIRKMHDALNNSNFQTEVHEYYLDLCAFGNGGLFAEDDEKEIVRFNCRPLKETAVQENSKGKVDVVYRHFELDARGLADEYGMDILPQKVKDNFKNNRAEKFEVINAIYPREIAGPAAEGVGPKFPFISQHVLVKDKLDLMVKGYREFPLIFGRWGKISGEIYGRGPGERAMPDTLTLNEMTKITIVGAQKMVDPPLQMPDDGFVMPLITRPAGVNYYRAGSPATDRVSPIFNDSKVDFGFQFIDKKAQNIRAAYYIDKLQLDTQGPQKTATEVQNLVDQALKFMAPMLGRQQSEFLAPLIARVYAIMSRRGMFLPVPQELNKVPLKVQYSSVMAAAQKQSEMANISRTLQAIGPIAAFAPTVTDNFNADRMAKFIARLQNFPQEGINDQTEVEAVRKQRAEQQQQQAAMAQAQGKADVMNTVSQANKNLQPG